MDTADDIHVLVVDGMPVESFLVEVENDTDVVIGLIDSFVLDLVTSFLANQLAREL